MHAHGLFPELPPSSRSNLRFVQRRPPPRATWYRLWASKWRRNPPRMPRYRLYAGKGFILGRIVDSCSDPFRFAMLRKVFTHAGESNEALSQCQMLARYDDLSFRRDLQPGQTGLLNGCRTPVAPFGLLMLPLPLMV